MKPKDLDSLSNEALLKKAKSMKQTKTYDALFIGLLMGISIFSIIKSGFGLLTFLPLLYIPIAGRNRKILAEIDRQLGLRNLK